jgi:hypothetical protein
MQPPGSRALWACIRNRAGEPSGAALGCPSNHVPSLEYTNGGGRLAGSDVADTIEQTVMVAGAGAGSQPRSLVLDVAADVWTRKGGEGSGQERYFWRLSESNRLRDSAPRDRPNSLLLRKHADSYVQTGNVKAYFDLEAEPGGMRSRDESCAVRPFGHGSGAC